jgi:hypothetical protein
MTKPLCLVSLNVQCLGREHVGIWKKSEIKEFFAKSTPKPNILLLQELKFSLQEYKSKMSQLEFMQRTVMVVITDVFG